MMQLAKRFQTATPLLRASLAAGRALPRHMPFTVARAGEMMCFQCEQTNNNVGCTTTGICGKTPDVALLQDLLIQSLKDLSVAVAQLEAAGKSAGKYDKFLLEAMFSTLTNVNFSESRIEEYIAESNALRKKALKELNKADSSVLASTRSEDYVSTGEAVGVLSRGEKADPDVFSVQELVCYGLKGLCAYADHARALGQDVRGVSKFVFEALAKLNAPMTLGDALGLALQVGERNVEVLALLDKGHFERFGSMEVTSVNCTPKPGKSILVSGHDINDLEAILKQCEGTGVNVYTHGELLPAHAYPKLKQYKCLAGHYGGAWQRQRVEFHKFPGAVVVTTNCIMPPSRSYQDRVFTTNAVGVSGLQHIANHDFSKVIAKAQSMEGFKAGCEEAVSPVLTTGFGYRAVLPTVVDLVKQGNLQRVFVIGGCDGSESARSYFRDLAKATPASSAVITLGCGKFRFNKLDLGVIPGTGVPRIVDVGQCNDAFGAVMLATGLVQELGLPSVNHLPIHFAISWFEQKAVAVLLSMLHLGIRNIHLGPRLPAFITPNVLNVLVEKFALKPTGSVESDLKEMLSHANNTY